MTGLGKASSPAPAGGRPAATPRGRTHEGPARGRKSHTNGAGAARPLQPQLGSSSLQDGPPQGKQRLSPLSPGWGLGGKASPSGRGGKAERAEGLGKGPVSLTQENMPRKPEGKGPGHHHISWPTLRPNTVLF